MISNGEGLSEEERRALRIDGARYDEVSDDDRAWFEEYRRTHRFPLDEATVARCRDYDLGLWMSGLEVCGYEWVEGLGAGNLNLAGGWRFRVSTYHDERGWHRGWLAELAGLHAFQEAMGQDSLDGSGDQLGPFDSQTEAYWALARRMLAALTIVSQAALAARPESELVRVRQQRVVDERQRVFEERNRGFGETTAGDEEERPIGEL